MRRGGRLLLLCGGVLFGTAAACIQPIEGEPDGGFDAGTTSTDSGVTPADSGVVDPHDGGGMGADAGSSDAGSSDAGTGETDAGMLGPLSWGQMTTTATSSFYAVGGSAADNVYAVGTNGQIHRFDGSAWSKVTQSPSNLDLRAVWVASDGAVFAGGGAQLVACEAGCTSAAAFDWSSVNVNVTGVCGEDANSVYAAGTNNLNKGVLYKYDAAQDVWQSVSSDLGAYSTGGCWVAPNGAVYIAAQSSVVRYQNSVLFKETVNFPPQWDANQIAQQYFEAVHGVEGRIFVTGYRRGIIERNAQGTWDYVIGPTGVNDYHALAGTVANGVLVGGSRSGDNAHLRAYDGATWSVPASKPDLDVWGLWAADENTYFAVGTKSGIDSAVFIGTR